MVMNFPAIPTTVTIAEILKANGIAVEKSKHRFPPFLNHIFYIFLLILASW